MVDIHKRKFNIEHNICMYENILVLLLVGRYLCVIHFVYNRIVYFRYMYVLTKLYRLRYNTIHTAYRGWKKKVFRGFFYATPYKVFFYTYGFLVLPKKNTLNVAMHNVLCRYVARLWRWSTTFRDIDKREPQQSSQNLLSVI